MINKLDNIYEIKNILAIKFKSDYKKYLNKDVLEKLENITYFDNNYYFINHEVLENEDGTYLEIYEDAILGIVLFERVVKEYDFNLPSFIDEYVPFTLHGLTSKEEETGLISTSKLFYNFQIINKPETKIKKFGIRRIG